MDNERFHKLQHKLFYYIVFYFVFYFVKSYFMVIYLFIYVLKHHDRYKYQALALKHDFTLKSGSFEVFID